MGYQNGGRRYFYRSGSCVFLLFLLVILLTTFLHPASRSDERAPEASLQRGVASARYDNLSFGILKIDKQRLQQIKTQLAFDLIKAGIRN